MELTIDYSVEPEIWILDGRNLEDYSEDELSKIVEDIANIDYMKIYAEEFIYPTTFGMSLESSYYCDQCGTYNETYVVYLEDDIVITYFEGCYGDDCGYNCSDEQMWNIIKSKFSPLEIFKEIYVFHFEWIMKDSETVDEFILKK